MKLSFPAGRHRIECRLSRFGFERYRVDGRDVLRAWSLGSGERRFAAGEGADRHEVRVKAKSTWRRTVIEAYVDDVLVLEAMPGPPPVTLIEILFVAAIIGVLAAISVPPDHGAPRYFLNNVHGAVKSFDEQIAPELRAYRERTKAWPAKNADLGLPADGLKLWQDRHVFNVQPDSDVVLAVHSKEGSELGRLSFRPALGKGGDIVVLCGGEAAPAGYQAVGENRGTLRGSDVPGRCR